MVLDGWLCEPTSSTTEVGGRKNSTVVGETVVLEGGGPLLGVVLGRLALVFLQE